MTWPPGSLTACLVRPLFQQETTIRRALAQGVSDHRPCVLDSFNVFSNYVDVLFELCYEFRICLATVAFVCNMFDNCSTTSAIVVEIVALLL